MNPSNTEFGIALIVLSVIVIMLVAAFINCVKRFLRGIAHSVREQRQIINEMAEQPKHKEVKVEWRQIDRIAWKLD